MSFSPPSVWAAAKIDVDDEKLPMFMLHPVFLMSDNGVCSIARLRRCLFPRVVLDEDEHQDDGASVLAPVVVVPRSCGSFFPRRLYHTEHFRADRSHPVAPVEVETTISFECHAMGILCRTPSIYSS